MKASKQKSPLMVFEGRFVSLYSGNSTIKQIPLHSGWGGKGLIGPRAQSPMVPELSSLWSRLLKAPIIQLHLDPLSPGLHLSPSTYWLHCGCSLPWLHHGLSSLRLNRGPSSYHLRLGLTLPWFHCGLLDLRLWSLHPFSSTGLLHRTRSL